MSHFRHKLAPSRGITSEFQSRTLRGIGYHSGGTLLHLRLLHLLWYCNSQVKLSFASLTALYSKGHGARESYDSTWLADPQAGTVISVLKQNPLGESWVQLYLALRYVIINMFLAKPLSGIIYIINSIQYSVHSLYLDKNPAPTRIV